MAKRALITGTTGLIQLAGAGFAVPGSLLDVEPVGVPGARALLLLQLDSFFGDVGEPVEGQHPAMAGVKRRR
jgi:hypothetical protein